MITKKKKKRVSLSPTFFLTYRTFDVVCMWTWCRVALGASQSGTHRECWIALLMRTCFTDVISSRTWRALGASCSALAWRSLARATPQRVARRCRQGGFLRRLVSTRSRSHQPGGLPGTPTEGTAAVTWGGLRPISIRTRIFIQLHSRCPTGQCVARRGVDANLRGITGMVGRRTGILTVRFLALVGKSLGHRMGRTGANRRGNRVMVRTRRVALMRCAKTISKRPLRARFP